MKPELLGRVALSIAPFVASALSKPSSTYTDIGSTATGTSYDYIIVGSGPGGLVTADRLSEAGKKVLVLERGGPSTGETGGTDVPPWANGTSLTRFDIPGAFESVFTATDPFFLCDNYEVFAGCLIGGGTSINGGLYWFPADSDFSAANGWPQEWQNHQPYTNKLKARLPSTITPSTDGKQYLEQVYEPTSKLLELSGYREAVVNDDPNVKEHIYGHTAFNFQGGKRAGPVASYLRTAKARENFKLLTYTKVSSVVRNGSTITGVRTNDTSLGPDGVISLNPRGRVVLSAGAFGTTQILIQSGIGTTDMISLVQANATMGALLPPSSEWIDVPVGFNVADNSCINLDFTYPGIDNYNGSFANIWDDPRPADAEQYLEDQSGVFATDSVKMNFWESTVSSDNVTRWVQGTIGPGAVLVNTTYPYNASSTYLVQLYLSSGLTSRGRIGLNADLQPRTLVGPWLVEEADKEALITFTEHILANVSQVEGLVAITPDNKTTAADFVNNYNLTYLGSNHWIGANRIATNPKDGVVDKDTKVFGTDNLFVVDASVIPSVLMGNPQGTIMSMAEHAVARILALPGGP